MTKFIPHFFNCFWILDVVYTLPFGLHNAWRQKQKTVDKLFRFLLKEEQPLRCNVIHHYTIMQRSSSSTAAVVLCAAWTTTWGRDPRLHVLILCLLHRIWVFLHSEPLYWRYHRQLQHAEKEGDLVIFVSAHSCHRCLSTTFISWRGYFVICLIL